MNDTSFDIIIAGAGLSGLSVAHFLKMQNPNLSILLLEQSNRAGGAIRSLKQDGFVAEWGAHGFLDNCAESRELLSDLGLEQQMQKAPLRRFIRYICINGKLEAIPQTPPAIIKSNLLSLPAKLRVLADLWKKPLAGEPSIAQWAAYRFGRAILPFADIAMTGTFAGDIEKLSIDAAMPGLRRLEKTYGSVFRGAIKSKNKNRQAGMPSMISFSDGMEYFTTKLAVNKQIRYNSPVTAIKPSDQGWSVFTADASYQARQLVIALPINRSLAVLNSLTKAPEQTVTEALVYNVVLGFDQTAVIPLGFGYLAPKTENRFALGTFFSIHMFPDRAPQGHKLIEILVGGTRSPQWLKLDDEQLIRRTYQDVTQLMPLPKPIFSVVLRPTSGIPQLELGHQVLIDYRNRLQQNHRHLHICGFGWQGIGINDMVKDAKQIATDVIRGEVSDRNPAQAKPIYF